MNHATHDPKSPLPMLAAGGYRLRVTRHGAGFDALHDAGESIYQAYAYADDYCNRLTANGLTVLPVLGGGWAAYTRGVYVEFAIEPVSVEGN